MKAIKTLTLCGLLSTLVPSWVGGQQAPAVDQAMVDNMAQALRVTWTVVTNTKEAERFDAKMTLTNTGLQAIQYGEWTMYFYSVYPLEPDALSRGKSLELSGLGVTVEQVNGMLYKLKPTSSFIPLPPGGSRVLRLHMKNWSVSRTDIFPNWYLTGSNGTTPRIIANTAGDDPTFVSPYYTLQQQKRYDYDHYPARTTQERYYRNQVPYEPPESEVRVIPTPLNVTGDIGSKVTLSSAWRVFQNSSDLTNEGQYLIEKLSAYSVTNATGQDLQTQMIILSKVDPIILITSEEIVKDNKDLYILSVDDDFINITGLSSSGVFWGIQTLLALVQANGTVPKVTIYDAPRFPFRGLFLDISRNFRSREEIERLLDVMAMYKLNKLHLHLGDDEGWRIEIDGLPELTELGSKRCHDLEEKTCLIPQLGSGPFSNNSGSGFLTRDDYQNILRKANRLHIEVIPEIDMPGHSRAAVLAMELRYSRYSSSNLSEAGRYRLIDPTDTSEYTTPQNFNDNAINVCIDSAYAFVTKVVQEIKKLHNNIQPLREFHCGFDEVGKGAWVNSTACRQLQNTNTSANQSLKQYFFQRIAAIAHQEGLALGSWEDGLMLPGNQPFNRSLAAGEVYVNVWDSLWERGIASRTHDLANMDYKVVMNQASHLYFDHPYEPQWEERGYYWATRFTDTQKTFGFMPMNYYANIHEKRSGIPVSREDICGPDDVNCPPLREPKNIVGMQGNLWSETVRTRDQVDNQLFPRLLALSERAWHRGPWEKETNVTQRQQLVMDDWYSFARAVGYRELPRLDSLGIKYRIPPPGAVVVRKRLWVATGYPGLDVEMSKDYGKNWMLVDGTELIESSDRLLLRSRSPDKQRYSRVVELVPEPEAPATTQTMLDYMGEYLNVQFEVFDNYQRYGDAFYVAKITLNNTGNQSIPPSNWELHFPNVQWVERDPVREEKPYILAEDRLAISHVNGYLFRLSPLPDFPPLENGTSREITFKCEAWSVSRYEQFPNYFVVAEGANPRVIKNTVGESLSFVKPFTRVNQWKRTSADKFDPLTPSARFGKQADVKDLAGAPHPYLPSPQVFHMDRSNTVSFAMGWVIVAPAQWTDVADFLKHYRNDTNLTVVTTAPDSRYIELRMSSDGVPQSNFPGAYNITIDPKKETIIILARNATGALYGVQSLINMALQSQDLTTVFQLSAADAPRFLFRGMFLDVARNFHSKDSVLKLLQVMGLYKLNRLHLHLADDEGWRLEIPGLPELTTVGSRRCHDPTEEICLVPVMGSGPDTNTSGSGFFTTQEYKEIMLYARERHIEVIPEFDMPGHARAAIKAMALRRRLKTEAGDLQAAHEFELDELGDYSEYSSIQMYNDDAINPCLESSYRFIRHVMREVQILHNDTNPLGTYHFGGDEVAQGAWVRSKACSSLMKKHQDLKLMFSSRVAAIAAELGLNLGAWEDGIMEHGVPIPREEMPPDMVFANAWQNVWEWGAASRAYALANAGYKVIMSQATHLYFDHPNEPDPEERGFYWATRYTDSRKAFLFQPDDLWSNVGITRLGDPITLRDLCGTDNKSCPALIQKDNIVGMQGHLWSETIRTAEHIEYMVFPRLLVLAERAWHKASWEGKKDGAAQEKLQDWTNFANSLGHSQLLVLDHLNVSYRICPPGVRASSGYVAVNTEFPGLKTQYMTSDVKDWTNVINGRVDVKNGQVIQVRTLSADGKRSGKPIRQEVRFSEVTTKPNTATALTSTATALLLLTVVTIVVRVVY